MQINIRNISKVVQSLLEKLFVRHILSVKVVVHPNQSTDRKSLKATLINGSVHRVRVEASYFLSYQFCLLFKTLPHFLFHDVKLAKRASLDTDVVSMTGISQFLRNTVVKGVDGAICGLHGDKFNEAESFC